jgi:hypothetical protein
MKKIIYVLLPLAFFLGGCSQKQDISYYLPNSSITEYSDKKPAAVSVDTASYLFGDKIWYKKDGLFLPYKNSYLAKSPKEFMGSELAANLAGSSAAIKVSVSDAYQSYENEKSSYVLVATVEIDGQKNAKKHKMLKITVDGLKSGPKEAVIGFEKAVKELCEKIKIEVQKI